ncbi:uncharacterized protein PV06_11934 [Exophiala oligosperma]|uniref:Uncharacterized protein n=1 Tax=Exophiala oligosperma TaxID=215243 RepID=A0A0D2DJ35_9EURO|nr:uncharacterized protein PV06_11934 [Exophiala oligosperma]KIW35724.1 hypothetical protein PV06_11934 [Exophiala oligosperma]
MQTLDNERNLSGGDRFEMTVRTRLVEGIPAQCHMELELCQHSIRESVPALTLDCWADIHILGKDLIAYTIKGDHVIQASLRSPLGKQIYDEYIGKKNLVCIYGSRGTESEAGITLTDIMFSDAPLSSYVISELWR